MQLGKTFLGDEGIERVKKGDFSQVVKMGEQFLGEDTMKDFMTAAADQFFQMKDNEDVMEIINGAADQILDKVQNLAKNKDKTKQVKIFENYFEKFLLFLVNLGISRQN